MEITIKLIEIDTSIGYTVAMWEEYLQEVIDDGMSEDITELDSSDYYELYPTADAYYSLNN